MPIADSTRRILMADEPLESAIYTMAGLAVRSREAGDLQMHPSGKFTTLSDTSVPWMQLSILFSYL